MQHEFVNLMSYFVQVLLMQYRMTNEQYDESIQNANDIPRVSFYKEYEELYAGIGNMIFEAGLEFDTNENLELEDTKEYSITKECYESLEQCINSRIDFFKFVSEKIPSEHIDSCHWYQKYHHLLTCISDAEESLTLLLVDFLRMYKNALKFGIHFEIKEKRYLYESENYLYMADCVKMDYLHTLKNTSHTILVILKR